MIRRPLLVARHCREYRSNRFTAFRIGDPQHGGLPEIGLADALSAAAVTRASSASDGTTSA
ncbi:MAG TPA: hypothetical protein VN326_12020 [Casimicrobiaceae bacterium]|jgi:hypothetical protein|nr:hypothetical protein [Casimicrobiaceae bacterium]